MNIVKCKDDLFAVTQAGHWLGLSPIKAKEVEKPGHRWHGKKIPMHFWRQICSFFEWSMAETKAETMVHLFYHEVEGWNRLVLPQEGYGGMSVKLLDDHPLRIPTFQILGDGWEMMGTVHHHCGCSAYQSDTDRSDEVTKEGLHITVGNIGATKYSFDARSSFRQQIFPVCLADWFELDDQVKALVPEELHDQLLKFSLIQPSRDSFPEWWKANVIKVVRAPVQQAFPGGEHWHNRHLPSHYQGHSNAPYSMTSGGYSGSSGKGWLVDMFEDDVDKLVTGYAVSNREVVDMIEQLQEEPYGSLINAMIESEQKLPAALLIAKRLEDEANQYALQSMTDQDEAMAYAKAIEQHIQGQP